MPSPFTCTIQARTSDVNAAAHVDNVAALRVADEARALFLGYRDPRSGAAFPGVLSALPPGMLPVVGSHHIEYRRELFASLDAPYTVQIWVAHLGLSSFTLDTTVSHPVSGPDPAVVVESTLVLVDLSHGAGAQLPDEVRTALSAYQGDPLPLRARPVG